MKNRLSLRIIAIITAVFFLSANISLLEAKSETAKKWEKAGILLGVAALSGGINRIGMGTKKDVVIPVKTFLIPKTLIGAALGAWIGHVVTRNKSKSAQFGAMAIGALIGGVGTYKLSGGKFFSNTKKINTPPKKQTVLTPELPDGKMEKHQLSKKTEALALKYSKVLEEGYKQQAQAPNPKDAPVVAKSSAVDYGTRYGASGIGNVFDPKGNRDVNADLREQGININDERSRTPTSSKPLNRLLKQLGLLSAG